MVKLVVLKGGDESVVLPQSLRDRSACSRNPGAVALSGDGEHWALLNLTPAVARQLGSDARLLRHPGLVGPQARVVVLTDAQLDHVTGLLSLRDGPPIHLYATPTVFEELTHRLPVLPLLQHYCGVQWHVIPVAGECRSAVFPIEGQPGLEFTAVALDTPRAPHLAPRGQAETPAGEAIALVVRDLESGRRLFFAADLRSPGAEALDWLGHADCAVVGCDRSDAPPVHPDAMPETPWAFLQGVPAGQRLLLCHPEDEGVDRPSFRSLIDWGIDLVDDRREIRV